MNWSRRFDEPITLPDGKKLATLKDAIAWLAKEVPKSEHDMKEVQAAAHCVTEAAENGGPIMFASAGMLQAINRHEQEEFDPKRKSPVVRMHEPASSKILIARTRGLCIATFSS
jgi:hypothetical protein